MQSPEQSSPIQPGAQSQVKLPMLLTQVPLFWQRIPSLVELLHSSISRTMDEKFEESLKGNPRSSEPILLLVAVLRTMLVMAKMIVGCRALLVNVRLHADPFFSRPQ